MKWKKSKKLSKKASGPYMTLQMKYPVNSKSFSRDYQNFSTTIKNSWIKCCPPLLAYRPVSSAATTPMLSANFAFYLYSSRYNGKRNSAIINGELD
jgi:hypothetical protein